MIADRVRVSVIIDPFYPTGGQAACPLFIR